MPDHADSPTWGDRWRALIGRDDDARPAELVPDNDVRIAGGPPEHPGGQDDDPPDLLLALVATLTLLSDVRDRLDRERDDRAADLRLRISAIAAVLARLRDLEGDGPMGPARLPGDPS